MHSSLSFDGHALTGKIIQATEINNIDFLLLTDRDHLTARNQGWEDRKGTILVIVGKEIAPRFNHYLASKIKEYVAYIGDSDGKNP